MNNAVNNNINKPGNLQRSVEILRYYPSKVHKKPYPYRYNRAVFAEYDKLMQNSAIRDNYKKWKNEINY